MIIGLGNNRRSNGGNGEGGGRASGLYDSLAELGYDEQTIAELNAMRDEDVEYGKELTVGSNSGDTSIVYIEQGASIVQGSFTHCYRLQIVPNIIVKGTSLQDTFKFCYSLMYVQLFDTSKVTNWNSTFQNCYAIKKIPAFDFSAATSMVYTFSNCKSLRVVPPINAPLVQSMNYLFQGCSSLEEVEITTGPSLKTAEYMFQATAIKTAPLFDTSGVTSFRTMFENCPGIESVPTYNMSKATNVSYMFQGCTGLTGLPRFDWSNVTTGGANAFTRCSALTDLGGFQGMKTALTLSACTKLTHDSLMNVINNLGTPTTSQTLTLGATNLAKLTDEEIEIAVNKGWTLK